MGKTLYQKLFDSHVVCEEPGELPILYVDRHLVHEVTSPQAFEGLRQNGRKIRRTDRTFATMDHNVSTKSTSFSACSELGRIQMETLKKNCDEFNVPLFGLGSDRQGIIHCVGPEIGATIPGVTLVCGDSHTATHGAFGALAFGIGTSEVEHVLATQTVKQARLKNMKIEVNGKLQKGVYPKDVILAIIARLGTAYGTGYAVEFTGDVFRDMSMEGRMTVSNMAIGLRRQRHRAPGNLGNQPRAGRLSEPAYPRSGGLFRSRAEEVLRGRSQVPGREAALRHQGHQGRQRLHRLLHQRQD